MLALHCCKNYPVAKLRAMTWCCIMTCNVQVLAAECCTYRAILRQILRSLEILTANGQHMAHRYFDTVLHKDMILHRHLHIHMLLPRDGFTRKDLHAKVFLHRDAFKQTKTFAHRRVGTFTHKRMGTFTHRRVGTSTRRCFYTAMLLQRNAFTWDFTQGFFWHKFVFSKYSYAEMFFYTETHVYNGVFLRTDTFTKRIFARILLRREAFTHRCF